MSSDYTSNGAGSFVHSLHTFTHNSRSDAEGGLIAPTVELECAMIGDMIKNGLSSSHLIVMEETEVVNGRIVILTDMYVCRVSKQYTRNPCNHEECNKFSTMGKVESGDDVKDWLSEMAED